MTPAEYWLLVDEVEGAGVAEDPTGVVLSATSLECAANVFSSLHYWRANLARVSARLRFGGLTEAQLLQLDLWSPAEKMEAKLQLPALGVADSLVWEHVCKTFRSAEELIDEYAELLGELGLAGTVVYTRLRAHRPVWYNIHVETNPDAMGRSGETSQDITPQGLQPEFERRPEVEGVVVSTRERLLAAQKAAEAASLELEEAERARLRELEKEGYVLILSSQVNDDGKGVRSLLASNQKIVIYAVDGADTAGLLVRSDELPEGVEKLSWSSFRRKAGTVLAERQQVGPLWITDHRKPYAVLHPASEKEQQFRDLARKYPIFLDMM